jgi:hypothetical protein
MQILNRGICSSRIGQENFSLFCEVKNNCHILALAFPIFAP